MDNTEIKIKVDTREAGLKIYNFKFTLNAKQERLIQQNKKAIIQSEAGLLTTFNTVEVDVKED